MFSNKDYPNYPKAEIKIDSEVTDAKKIKKRKVRIESSDDTVNTKKGRKVRKKTHHNENIIQSQKEPTIVKTNDKVNEDEAAEKTVEERRQEMVKLKVEDNKKFLPKRIVPDLNLTQEELNYVTDQIYQPSNATTLDTVTTSSIATTSSIDNEGRPESGWEKIQPKKRVGLTDRIAKWYDGATKKENNVTKDGNDATKKENNLTNDDNDALKKHNNGMTNDEKDFRDMSLQEIYDNTRNKMSERVEHPVRETAEHSDSEEIDKHPVSEENDEHSASETDEHPVNEETYEHSASEIAEHSAREKTDEHPDKPAEITKVDSAKSAETAADEHSASGATLTKKEKRNKFFNKQIGDLQYVPREYKENDDDFSILYPENRRTVDAPDFQDSLNAIKRSWESKLKLVPIGQIHQKQNGSQNQKPKDYFDKLLIGVVRHRARTNAIKGALKILATVIATTRHLLNRSTSAIGNHSIFGKFNERIRERIRRRINRSGSVFPTINKNKK